jgi:hypothetical protein
MSVVLHRVSQRIPARGWADENLQFAAAVIVEPLDAPLTCLYSILKNLGWLCHAAILLSCANARLPRYRVSSRLGSPLGLAAGCGATAGSMSGQTSPKTP